MRSVHHGPPTWLVAQVAVLSTLAATFGLGALGWALGMACAALIDAGLALGLARIGARRIGPADRVTLTRATLACGVAALTADAFVRPPAVSALVALTVVALVLDSVDGAVARRTGTTSALGARFDMEVDAFLILVLSVHVARSAGAWVLLLGAARYAFAAAAWVWPWLRGSLPARPWRKVVAAVVGIVLVCACSELLPALLSTAALLLAVGLLAESFGRDVRTLWRGHVRGGLVRRPAAA